MGINQCAINLAKNTENRSPGQKIDVNVTFDSLLFFCRHPNALYLDAQNVRFCTCIPI
jgi:hypothetical protein